MSKVSFYQSVKHTNQTTELDLDDIMTSIQIGEYKAIVEQVRQAPDEKAKKKAKLALPAFTGSGTFSERKNEAIVKHSGRIIIDLDHVENIDEAKSLLGADEFIEYVFTSVGGEGLALVFKIDGDKHGQSFQQIKDYIESKYDYKVDKGVKEIARLRFVSYDPDLIYNSEATQWESQPLESGEVYDVDRIKHIIGTNLAKAIDGERHFFRVRNARLAGGFVAGGMISEDEMRDFMQSEIISRGITGTQRQSAFKTIEDGLEYGRRDPITPENAHKYDKQHEQSTRAIKEVFAYAHAVNRAGRNFGKEDISNQAEQHALNFADVEKMFKRVFHENKDEFGIDNKPEIHHVELFLDRNYEFFFNEVTQIREYRPRGSSKNFERVNYDTVWRALSKSGSKFPLEKLKSLLRSDYVTTYNPFESYFDSLPTWRSANEEHDPIGDLASYVKTTTQDFWVGQFKKALVRQVACALSNYVNRIVIVLVSEEQSTGKSTFIRFLNPFGLDYYTESPLQSNKDTEFAFVENFIYNLEELSSLSNTDVNRLKAIISKASIKERKPYAQDAESQPRRCTFWGSTNKDEFLTDIQNTRWLCFTVKEIDWKYTQEIDINAVYAQAFALYNDKTFNFELDYEEQEKRDFINRGFEVVDIEKELIMLHFQRVQKEGGDFLSNADIFERLTNFTEGKVKLNTRLISKSMVQLDFERGLKKANGHTVRGFWVRQCAKASYKTNNDADLSLEEKIKLAKQRREEFIDDSDDDTPF
jgi:predicted P-loop ATPase